MNTPVQNIDALRDQANKAKMLYKTKQITRKEAQEMAAPYINAFNEKSTAIAKKYNQKPKTITFASYVR